MKDKPIVVGCDECGWGSWAGSLFVGGVRAPKDWSFQGLNDSKKLTPAKRATLRPQLIKLASDNVIAYYLAERSNKEIDKMGASAALKSAYIEVFNALYQEDCLIICDGNLKFDVSYDWVSVIKADGKYPAVMAASILAKTYHDEKMQVLHKEYPQYGWDHNVGYHSSDHVEALNKYGPTPYHRMSYKPMKDMKIIDRRQLSFEFNNGKPVQR